MLLTGAGADEATLKREVAGKRVVHLATHGFFLDESCDRSAPVANPWSSVLPDEISGNPLLLSGLALAGANQARDSTGAEDGILTAEEVASLNLDGVELVVLSACETGRGGAVTGQGVLGLRRALEIAGARTVVMSLWQVPDREARRWMTTMYAEWLDGAPVAEAARRASLAALERLRERGQSAHPYLWTGFVTAGDWR